VYLHILREIFALVFIFELQGNPTYMRYFFHLREKQI